MRWNLILVTRRDIYYLVAIIVIVIVFGSWVIPQFAQILILHATPLWVQILIVCIVLPLVAITLLWLIIQEIQSHYKKDDTLKKDEVKENILVDEAFTDEDYKFIEEKLKEKLEKYQYDDEEVFELSKNLIHSYLINQIKTKKVIPLIDISQDLEIPLEVVKDIVLLLIADDLIDGMIETDALIISE